MKNRMKSEHIAGFTLIELLISIAIAVVLATLAAPSFTSFMASQKIKGLGNEITTDLSYAKMESVQKNAIVTVAFSSTGYTITSAGTTLKQVVISGNNTLSPASGSTYTNVNFDPVRATADVTGGSIDVSNISDSSLSLRVSINVMGRSQICSPSASVTGYISC